MDIFGDTINASNLKQIALFAPPNCTGNSGIIGDTILQTSLARTLLDRSLFPQLEKVHWWGAKWVVDQLFGYLEPHVETYDWNGSVKDLPDMAEIRKKDIQAILICTRDIAAIDTLRENLSDLPCYTPAKPLQAQSSTHLCHQLHSCLTGLGVYVTDLPSPRIVVTQEEIENAQNQMIQANLFKSSTERVVGKQDFDPDADKIFIVIPAVGASEDRRTWSRDTWKALVRILAEVGVVVVYYNPQDEAQRRAAGDMVSGEPSFKSRFAIGLKLRELAAWACVSTVNVVRDSGPMHVVAATVGPKGRPRVLGLVSVMHPDTWKPLSENLELMGQWPLPLNQCVTPDQVAVKAASIEKM